MKAKQTKKVTIIKRTANKYLVAMLEEKLEQAKKGEIVGMVGAALWHDNTTNNYWNGGIETALTSRLVGELHMLMIDFTCASQEE